MLDGTGINHSAVEITAVEQLVLGRIRLSGVPSDFAPGSVGERALKDFLFDLGGQAGSVECDANITRIATTLGADRPVIYVDNVGVSHYEQTVDLQFQVRHAANFFDVYRSTAFSNALFAINAARGYGINSTAFMLGQPVRRRPLFPLPKPSRSFIPPKSSAETSPLLKHPRLLPQGDGLWPWSIALAGAAHWQPPLPYFRTTVAYSVAMTASCDPLAAARASIARYDVNGDGVDPIELQGLVREHNGTQWSVASAEHWLGSVDRGGDARLDLGELAASWPGFVPLRTRCVKKISTDIFGVPEAEYLCVPWERCGVVPNPSRPLSSGDTWEYNCDFGMCMPDGLTLASGREVPVDKGLFRCWDSCWPAEPIPLCPSFDGLLQLDTVDEPLSSAGRPLNLSAQIGLYAASCQEDFGENGFGPECTLMRCHYMGIALAKVCDDGAVRPPCRSVCVEYGRRVAAGHSLPQGLTSNLTSSRGLAANYSDCESLVSPHWHLGCILQGL